MNNLKERIRNGINQWDLNNHLSTYERDILKERIEDELHQTLEELRKRKVIWFDEEYVKLKDVEEVMGLSHKKASTLDSDKNWLFGDAIIR